jgi:uncharacterized protein (TIGR03435 family)
MGVGVGREAYTLLVSQLQQGGCRGKLRMRTILGVAAEGLHGRSTVGAPTLFTLVQNSGQRFLMRIVILLSLCFLTCARMPAQQTPGVSSTFSVAIIKPSAPDAVTVTQIRGNRFATEGTTFVDVFKYAYNVHPDQVVGGPEWLRTQKFDILADPETEKRPSSDQMKVMVQQLLAERFHLVMHHEAKILSVYALEKTADTPKLTKSAADPSGIPVVGYDPRGELEVGNATMANFATFLQRFVLDRPVVDQTGIAGHFDLVLRWTPDNFPAGETSYDPQKDASAPPDLFTAIKEQLRLKLKPTKAATDVFLIDRVERPSEN